VDTSADQFSSILNVPDDDDERDEEEDTEVYQSLLRNNNSVIGSENNNANIDDVIPEEFAPTTFNICPTFFTLVLYTIYFFGVCGGSIYILVLGKEPDCTDQPLLLWIQVQMIILVFGLLVRIWTTLNEYKGITLDVQRLSLCMRFQSKMAIFLQKVGNMFWCVWFLIGTVWTFKSQACAKASPPIYIFCLTVVIINLFLIGLCILCCICTCVCIGFCYMINPDSFRQDDVRGASKKVIEKLETKKFSKGIEGLEDEDAKCAICLSNYEEGEELRYLPCKPKKHHYHRECVDEWLLLNKTCPFCKRPIDEVDQEENKSDTSTSTTNTTNNNTDTDTDNTLTAD